MDPATPKGRGWRRPVAIAAGVATMCAGGGVASAGGGGIGSPAPPELSGVLCLERCAGQREAAVGSLVRLEGRNLDGVEKVKFAADGGRIAVAPNSVAAATVEARVPDGAVTGTVRVTAFGAAAKTPRDEPLQIVAEGQIPAAGEFKLDSARATPHSTYYDGVRLPSVTYMFQGTATDVRIEVVNRESKEVVETLVDQAAEPNTLNRASWDGLTRDGRAAANGDYEFRIANATRGDAETTGDSGFGFHKYRFPIDAHHTYGDGFGAGRRHQGQDVMTPCGTTLRAARGGRVQFNKTQSAAGNYLVIDGKATKMDFMYAHMLHRSPLRHGARVRTGQVIGEVGQTGNAQGCHLHFEVWSAPGWYEGGHPLPSVGGLLKTWDAWT